MDVDTLFNTFALPIKWRRNFILVSILLFYVAFTVTKTVSLQATEDVLSGTEIQTNSATEDVHKEPCAAPLSVNKVEQTQSPILPVKKKIRYFGLGANKTGTTSLKRALQALGFRVGSEPEYEKLLPHWIKRNFQVIVDYVRQDESDAFQDVPFSHDFTYQALDLAFPESKFILTERSSSDVWFESLRRFHGKLFNGTKMITANNGTTWNTPTISDLKEAKYSFPGFIYSWVKSVFDLPDNDEDASKLLYNKDHFIGYYERHNLAVKFYFPSRPDDLLVLNVEDDDAMERLCSFVGKPCPGRRFPHENQT